MKVKLYNDVKGLSSHLDPESYQRLMQRVNGGIVLQKMQSRTVAAVHDAALPFLKSSLVAVPEAVLKEDKSWISQELERWHKFSHIALWKFDRTVEYEGRLYLQGPRLEGAPLSLHSHPFSVSDTIVFLEESLSFLQMIHDSGYIMGSLCPDSIFWKEHVCFVDIGLEFELAKKHHQPGMPLHINWEYQPPEVFLSAQLTPAADIYALGIITWEAILGQVFDKGEGITELMQWHQQGYPMSMHHGKAGLPVELSALLEGMCSKSLPHRINIEDALKVLKKLRKEHVLNTPGKELVKASKITLPMQHSAIEMIRIPAGTFTRGGPDEDGMVDLDELPAHRVTLTKKFFMSTTLITQEIYYMVMNDNPSSFTAPKRPVENISWMDAIHFCNGLSRWLGFPLYYRITNGNVECIPKNKGFRLPTEAEWEFAANAGSNTKFSGSNTLCEVGHFEGNRELFGSVAVGQYKPNPWGLFDMSGNVMEWCYDGYEEYSEEEQTDPSGDPEELYKIARGGAWNRDEKDARIKKRKWMQMSVQTDYLGFRIVREA